MGRDSPSPRLSSVNRSASRNIINVRHGNVGTPPPIFGHIMPLDHDHLDKHPHAVRAFMGARSYGQGGALAPPGILAFTLENLAVCGILGVRSDQES